VELRWIRLVEGSKFYKNLSFSMCIQKQEELEHLRRLTSEIAEQKWGWTVKGRVLSKRVSWTVKQQVLSRDIC
jgi:hypothetical protein